MWYVWADLGAVLEMILAGRAGVPSVVEGR